jgi:hypothetical protein
MSGLPKHTGKAVLVRLSGRDSEQRPAWQWIDRRDGGSLVAHIPFGFAIHALAISSTHRSADAAWAAARAAAGSIAGD